MKFEEKERIAFARLLSDLVESDSVVEVKEMDLFAEIIGGKEFRITSNMLSEAKGRTFAQAVGTLQQMVDETKKAHVKEMLCKMSLSDGCCVPLEALQIMAVKYALDGKGEVFSIPSGNSFIENMQVLYIENSENTDIDGCIKSQCRFITNEFSLAGFDFVYIPNVAEDFRHIRGQYLHKVISYMMPLLSEAKIEKIQDDLCSMTTSCFTRDLLFKKMGLNLLRSRPAFLFKIGESYVADNTERSMYSNFLLIPINAENIQGQVVELTDFYRSMVSCNITPVNRPTPGKFLYSGFHRSLFDMIAYGRNKAEYRLVINLHNKANPVVLRPISYEDADDLPIDLNPQPYALYILTIYMSLFYNGLDWKDYPHDSPTKKEILRKYNVIYSEIGKGNINLEYRDKSHISRIKKSLKNHEKIVSNIDLFVPEKTNDIYTIPVYQDLVYVVEEGREVRMSDSDFWKNL